MRKLFLFFAACAMALSALGQNSSNAISGNKMAFVVEGPENRYNQIKVVNNTSVPDFQCRVVFLNDDNTVKEPYGIYHLKGFGDSDFTTRFVKQGQRIGIQLPNDFPKEVVFVVEYKDYPLFDAILIHINEQSTDYDDSF